jgi:hypothetical protein
MSRTALTIVGIMPFLIIGAIGARAEPARQAWLEDAWSDETVDETGGPAVTLEAGGEVIVVLPAKTLAAARRAGLSTKAAVTRFIERWGQHCSDVLDLDQPHAGLRVVLSLSRATRLPGLFVSDDEEVPLVIDYVPMRRVSCAAPGAEAPIS